MRRPLRRAASSPPSSHHRRGRESKGLGLQQLLLVATMAATAVQAFLLGAGGPRLGTSVVCRRGGVWSTRGFGAGSRALSSSAADGGEQDTAAGGEPKT